MAIHVDIEKNFGSFCLKTKFEAGNETIALLGASGCGKSMTLKCIAGIVHPDQGKIIVDGVTLFDSEKGINLTPQERKTGLMFQNYALFPNMTVLENIRAGAKREPDAAQREESVRAVMESFGLAQLASRYPAQLSGGQQQRVALARMLVSNPRILLLDEPFSALDSHLRFHLEQDLRKTLRAFGGTVLLVSHDRDEVYRLSDRVAVMGNGCIDTIGTNGSVFADPKTVNAAILTGCKNISPIRRLDDTHLEALDWGITLEVDTVGEAKAIGIRMHGIRAGSGENTIPCTVEQEVENPFSYTVFLRPAGAKSAIGWELDKDSWRKLRAPRQEISIPRASILLLKE